MAAIDFKLDVDTRGPIFEHIADNVMDACAKSIEEQVADKGVDLIRNRLHAVLRHPTGYYESHVRAERSGSHWEVNDSGVVYGPWLEGVGSRNRTTRFKGYATFRRATDAIDRAAGDIANDQVDHYAGRLD